MYQVDRIGSEAWQILILATSDIYTYFLITAIFACSWMEIGEVSIALFFLFYSKGRLAI